MAPVNPTETRSIHSTMTADTALTDRLAKVTDAAISGNRLAARIELESVLISDPKNPAAWLWQAWTADSPAAAKSALRRAAELCPGNQVADAGLAWIAGLERLAAGQPLSIAEVSIESELHATLSALHDEVLAALFADGSGDRGEEEAVDRLEALVEPEKAADFEGV